VKGAISRPRIQRLPTGAGQPQHYRPVRGAGVPFAREYSGYLDNAASAARRFPARSTPRADGSSCCWALTRRSNADRRRRGGDVSAHGNARLDRDRRPCARYCDARPDDRQNRVASGDAVVLGTGGYGNVYYLSTNAKGSNATAIWRAYKRGALFGNPCFTQIHRRAFRSPAIINPNSR